jgi:phenylacetate-CoA ligase
VSPRSTIPGLAWPLILVGQTRTTQALQAQFRRSERHAPEHIDACQRIQLEQLAAHARAQSFFWQGRLDAAGFGKDERWFEALPVLTRQQVKSAGNAVLAKRVPLPHGEIHSLKTSGSTGTPLLILKTELALMFWRAITVRDSLWHGRNLRGKLAAIRVGATQGTSASWGAAYDGYSSGPGVAFDAREDVDAQLDWLLTEQPEVLLTHPSNLMALVTRSMERGIRVNSLREARTYSESLPPELRSNLRDAWGVPLSDMYSTNEVGYIALQCPESGLYHVQSEDVLVEILDDDGRACGAGESGRVVVTSLHNFAMPLIRYDTGDHATVGNACSCGRTLPTLERILGRTRNMMRLPGGRMAWPGFPMNTLVRFSAIRELKMIQHSLEEIEVMVVLARELTPEETTMLVEAIQIRLGHPFRIRLTPVAQIERGPGHKREDFECRMT